MPKSVRDILEAEHGYKFDGNGRPADVPLLVGDEAIPPAALAAARRMDSLRSDGRAPRQRRYPWSQMHHGQSFVVGTPAERRAARMSLIAYLKTKKCHLDGDHYMISQSLGRGEGYRCWLISADEIPLADRPSSGGPSPEIEDGMPIPLPKE